MYALSVIKNWERQSYYEKNFVSWLEYDKTYIILNGGTSNNIGKSVYSDEEYYGTMEQNLKILQEKEIPHTTFFETDLNNMLSAIVFLVDERVWDKELYPDFIKFYENKHQVYSEGYGSKPLYILKDWKPTEESNPEDHKEWKNLIGGDKNVFLREFLQQFKLA